jgi:hypothetical protein
LFHSVEPEFGYRELGHGADEADDGGGVGAAGEADDEAAGAALAHVVEEAEGDGAGEFFFLDVLAGLPTRGKIDRFFRLQVGVGKIDLDAVGAGTRQVRGERARAGLGHAGGVDVHDGGGELVVGVGEARGERDDATS